MSFWSWLSSREKAGSVGVVCSAVADIVGTLAFRRQRCAVREVLRALGGERGEDGQAERAADLPRGVDQVRGQARVRALDPGHSGDRRRYEGKPEAGRRD